MNADSIREKSTHRPFEPFKFVVSGGERHIVKHPEFLMLLPSRAIIGDPITNQTAILSLMHIIELRPMQQQASS